MLILTLISSINLVNISTICGLSPIIHFDNLKLSLFNVFSISVSLIVYNLDKYYNFESSLSNGLIAKLILVISLISFINE